MEHKNHDTVFFINFGIVLAVLGFIFFVCIFAARLLIPEKPVDPESAAAMLARIKPLANVVTDPNALVVAAAAGPKRAPFTGEEVLAKVCNTCHQAGVLGAPKEGDKAAWQARLSAAGGVDGLVASATKGKNSMPPKGGQADLTEDELKSAIQAMLKLGGL